MSPVTFRAAGEAGADGVWAKAQTAARATQNALEKRQNRAMKPIVVNLLSESPESRAQEKFTAMGPLLI
jgi:2-methylisocitrate lyase-like PEP mutase family enzyme